MENNIIASKATKAVAAGTGKPKAMKDYVKSMEAEIARQLPKMIDSESFIRTVLNALSTNPKLGECTPKSFLGTVMTAAQLGVILNSPLGEAYAIPYMNHGVLECQFQLGYKGLMRLAQRSGEIKIIQAKVVHENDEFDYEFGLEPKLKHKPAKGERGKPIYYYASFQTVNGGVGFEVMSKQDIDAHAQKYSKSFSKGPWQTNYDEMALKTVLKRVLNYAPLSTESAKTLAQDETIKSTISEDMFSVPDETVYEADYEVDTETGEVKEN